MKKLSLTEILIIIAIILLVIIFLAPLAKGGSIELPSWYNIDGDNWTKATKMVSIPEENVMLTINELVISKDSDKVELIETRLFFANESFLKKYPTGIPMFALIDTDNNGKGDTVISINEDKRSSRIEKLNKELDMTSEAVFQWLVEESNKLKKGEKI